MSSRSSLLAFALVAVGCGQPSHAVPDAGIASLSGSLAFNDAGAREAHLGIQGEVTGFEVFIENHGMSCTQLEAMGGDFVPNDHEQIDIKIGSPMAGTLPGPGTYPINPSVGPTILTLSKRYPDGGGTPRYLASEGAVVLTIASLDEVAGSFHVTVPDEFGQPGTLSGTFDAPFCAW